MLDRYIPNLLIHGLGFLLTMSPMAGVNFADEWLPSALQYSSNGNSFDVHYHVLERLRKRWTSTGQAGTAIWEAKNAEWLLLNIITELHVTPKTFRIPSIREVYVPVVRTLVSEASIVAWTSH